ncbi:MAG TPA: hypothetical protein VKC59_06710 [Candidatus Limnocylindrales bacterium]|nr:hypothetical protein [Candidatus Limnocylindrales bacterium]
MTGRRLAASALIGISIALASCTSTEPTPAQPTATPGPGDPLPNAEAAAARAASVAEIAGPFKALEIVSGRFDALDPESHNAPFDPAAPARWASLADRQVWRVTFAGPGGRESAVLDAGTGELLAAVIQGQ